MDPIITYMYGKEVHDMLVKAAWEQYREDMFKAAALAIMQKIDKEILEEITHE